MQLKAVKKRSKLRIKVSQQSTGKIRVVIDRRKGKKVWRSVKTVEISSSRLKKSVNLKRGNYRARVLANPEFGRSPWRYARLKR